MVRIYEKVRVSRRPRYNTLNSKKGKIKYNKPVAWANLILRRRLSVILRKYTPSRAMNIAVHSMLCERWLKDQSGGLMIPTFLYAVLTS